MSDTPTSFKDLKKDQLVVAAERFGTDTEGSVEALRASLLESGVTWAMYAEAFGLEAPAPKENTITSTDVTSSSEEDEDNVTDVVTVEEKPVLAKTEKYLIKMTRHNPYFEFRKHKFTQENPYVIMDAADAQDILSTEEGFRQAFPQELQEFYS